MIIRLSQKLGKKIKVAPAVSLPSADNPLADWSAHLFTAERAQHIIVTNTVSLYSTVMHGRGITTENRLLVQMLAAIQALMVEDGMATLFGERVAPAANEVHFSKSLNRSVTGSMNDLIFHAKAWLAELSPHEVASQLNTMPMSALKYRAPRKAFEAL